MERQINDKTGQNEESKTEFTQSGVSSSYLKADQSNFAQKNSHDNIEMEDPKNTMDSLCKSFLKRYENSQQVFEPRRIATELNANLRRVYDMINILQGGLILQKVEKGYYQWTRASQQLNQSPVIFNGDWSSLRLISNSVKRIFSESKKGYSCHQLFNILTSKQTAKFNPNTIRRRIYECCKVFSIFEVVKKVGKTFYNAKFNSQSKYINKNLNPQKYKNTLQGNIEISTIQQRFFSALQFEERTFQESKMDYETPKKFNKQKKEMKFDIIQNIVKSFESQLQLQSFIKTLRMSFKKRKFSQNKEQLKKQLIKRKQEQFQECKQHYAKNILLNDLTWSKNSDFKCYTQTQGESRLQCEKLFE